MSIVVDFPQADLSLIETQAAAQNITVEEFIRENSAKAARNAAYLARIRKAKANLDAGKGKYYTNEELRELVYGRTV